MKIKNNTGKPDNIVKKEYEFKEKCMALESTMPKFMKEYFIYLKTSVQSSTRLAYLEDICFFLEYMIEEQILTDKSNIFDITQREFNKIKARDINLFLGDYCTLYYKTKNNMRIVFENNNRSLARKKASLSTLFKFLYRNEQIDVNIVSGFNPIKLPKPQPDAIKRLEINEVEHMLSCVESGEGLSDSEKKYWKKTKYRDKAILALFVTYGLRISELRDLNISSFNFSRKEFRIFRKRQKEVLMPINETCKSVIIEYIEKERTDDDFLNEEYKDALFLSLQEKRLTERAIRELVKKYTSIALNSPRKNGYSPHKLRATAATSLIQNGFSIYDVQNLLDHDNVTTTQLYAAHKKNVKKTIVEKFEWIKKEE
ncbi:MAG: tyrosine-type recombinase/integrase [Peptostreptococcaceae bacterium]